jgi:hypothetical protein
MKRPPSRVPRSDSAFRGRFIQPWAAPRMSPKPDVNAETLIDAAIIQRFKTLVGDHSNGGSLDV